MDDGERDALLLELRDMLSSHDALLRDHGERLERIEAKVDAVDDRVSDVARAVRELGGHVVDEPPVEATG